MRGHKSAAVIAAPAVLVLLAFTRVDTSLWLIRCELLALGLGFGLLLGRLITVVQRAAPRSQMAVAIAGVRLFGRRPVDRRVKLSDHRSVTGR